LKVTSRFAKRQFCLGKKTEQPSSLLDKIVEHNKKEYESRLKEILKRHSLKQEDFFSKSEEKNQLEFQRFLQTIAEAKLTSESVTILPTKKGNNKHSRVWAVDVSLLPPELISIDK